MNSWKVEKPDRLLNTVKDKFSNSYSVKDLKWSIEHNRCFVNNLIERFSSREVTKGDTISFFPEKSPLFSKEPERILFEDHYLLVYNKPAYLTSEKLAEFTQAQLAHRLDRDTSGVILLAKDQKTLADLEKQFLKRTIAKHYLALVEGMTQKEGQISGKMAPQHKKEGAVIWKMSQEGLWSQTHWRRVKCLQKYTLLQCIPLTGRTHQIRVHLKHIGHPIVGDYTYGSQKKGPAFRPLLHAFRLSFTHPHTQERITLSSPLPQDFFKYILPLPLPLPVPN